MYKRLELHNHTNESDAVFTCKELTDFMVADQVDAFALTDHNTISGHCKIKNYLKEHPQPIAFIPGMEYTTYYGHILCLNLTEYVPWENINRHKPEPLHEVNEKGVKLWENLVLSGEKLAATCGMDLHGNSTLHGHYSTYIQGEPDGDVCRELSDAIHNQRTWVCKGSLLEVHNDGEALPFTIHQTGKPGYEPLIGDDYKITLRTKDRVITCNVSDRIPLASFAEHAIIIPMLFEKETIIENLVCTSPVIHL